MRHHLLHLGARQRLDVEAELLGVGEERRIGHRLVERRAQHFELRRRRVRRRDVGAVEYGLADDQFDHLAVLFAFDELEHARHAHLGQQRMRFEADLHQDVGLVVAQPVRLLRAEARPVPAADAVDLAALHGERHLGVPR